MNQISNRKKNQGFSLLTVIVAVAFIGILGLLILYIAMANFQMKITDMKGKDSFYTAEKALEEVRTGLQEDVGEAMSVAYIKVLETYSKDSDVSSADATLDELRQASFKELFVKELVSRLKYGSDTSQYSLEKLNGYLDLTNEENFDETKNSLMRELRELKAILTDACKLLTQAREKKASELAQAIQKELHDLNFNDSSVKIAVEPLKEPTAEGMDKVEILITTNKGEPLKPLYKIVSGGEMSRIMLAFKNIISSYDKIPTLIFDEIDNGISGITASIVGKKLKEISNSHQVICITHLPQIAAAGDHNYRIYKESDESSTYTSVEALDEEKKVEEIARLLGGTVITQTTLKSARELIEG